MTDTLTVHEAAELLRVSKTTIRRKAMDGTIPALRLGSRLRFSRETLERMLSHGNVAHTGEAQCTTVSIKGTTHRTGGHHGQKTDAQSAKARASGSRTTREGQTQSEPGQAYSLASINQLLNADG